MTRVGATLLLALTTACAGPKITWQVSERLGAVQPRVVVVYPFRFLWPEPKWRTYQKSRDLVRAVLDDGRFLVVAPAEFTVYRPEDPNVLAGAAFLPRLMELGLRPAETLALQVWAEERREESTRLVLDRRGRPVAKQREEERRVFAHLRLVDAARGEVLLQADRTIHFDPFAPLPDADPLHPLTEALGEMVRRALRRLPAGAELEDGGLEMVVNPAAAAPAAGADPIETELRQLAFFDYFAPSWSPSQRRALLAAGRGALVIGVAGAAAEAGLKPGDLIVACNDMPVSGPETILRHLNRAQHGVRLAILRDGRQASILLPRSERH